MAAESNGHTKAGITHQVEISHIFLDLYYNIDILQKLKY